VGAIGDIVCAIPAFAAIRRAYPDARLTLLTTPGRYSHSLHAEELLGNAEWIDEIILYDLEDVRTREQRRAFGAKLRARRFDVWFDLTLDRTRFARMLRDMLFAKLIGARWACGWRLEHIDFAAKAEAEVIDFPNEVERLMGMLSRGGIESGAVEFPLPLNEMGDPFLPRIIRESEMKSVPIVAIAPGARRSCNLWPSERFAAVAIDLVSRGITIVLIGGPEDYLMCEDLASQVGSGSNLVGKLSIPESCALLRRCDLLICVDSGPQHLAAAVGNPCVALFSQRNQRRRWYPYGNNHIVLEGSVECHTCLLDTCPNDNRCMKQISIEDVLAAAHEKLGEKLSGNDRSRMCAHSIDSSQLSEN
jgi:ADP-heptose:LPS heptosyltransferase